MFQFLDYNDFFSEIKMYTKPTVIVEGNNDVNLVKNLFNRSNVDSSRLIVISPEIRGLNRKGIVIKVIKEIYNNFPYKKRIKYLGIIDSDFNKICGRLVKGHSNLFYTDKHDFDAQIFSTIAFKKCLQFYYEAPSNINMEDVKNKCVEIAGDFGYYLLSFYENNFHDLKSYFIPIEQYMDKNLSLLHQEIENKLHELNNNGIISSIELKDILSIVQKRKKQTLDPYHITNGHDLIRVLVMLTLWDKMNLKRKGLSNSYKKKLLNSQDQRKYFINELENLLRIAYEFSHFTKSDLYKKIVSYQKKIGIDFIDTS